MSGMSRACGETPSVCANAAVSSALGLREPVSYCASLGTGNVRDAVFMGLHVCQMMGYQEIMDSYKLISANAAKTLHLGENYGIQAGRPASFIILDADNFYNALNRKSEVLLS